MPNSGKTDFLNDLTCRIMQQTDRFVCYLSFEVPDKNKHIARLVSLMLGKANTTAYTDGQLTPYLDFLDTHMIHLDMHEVPPTPENILNRADRVRRTHPLKYLVVDPYLFIETQSGNGETETQSIKAMLTKFQTWGRVNHIWVVIVAHPRGLKTVNGRNELEAINMYTISGSANWANLADFILTVSRISVLDRAFTRIDMLKVRDQELCRTGTVYYTRRPADAMKSTKAKRNAARNKGRPHERMHRLMRTYVWGCAYICVRLHVYTCKLMHTSALPTYGKPTCGQTPGLSLRPSQIPENQLHLYRIEHPLPVGITRIRQSTVKHLVVMHP